MAMHDMPHLHPTSVFNPHTSQAQAIVDLFYIDLLIAAVIFLTVAGLVLFVAIRFRHRDDRAPEPYQDDGNPKLETLWTVIPALILLVLMLLTARTMFIVNPPVGERQPDVIVTAHQWWWEYCYPGAGLVTANELHMVAGSNWLLRIESADVIHSFWVPDLGSKMDAIPGHPNFLWLEPLHGGTYLGTCAEYCGAEHALMGIRVVVQSPAQFEAWTRNQLKIPDTPTDAIALRGAQLFEQRTCLNCHRIAGTKAQARVGPDLTHLADRQTLGAGTVSNTLENLIRWIENPQAVKPGCNMPNMRLASGEARQIAVYLEGLK